MQARGAAGRRSFWCCVEKGFKIPGVKRIFLGKEASAHGRSYTRCARDGEARATAWSKGGVKWGVGRDDVIYKRNNCDKNRKRNLFGFIARIFLTFSAHKKFSAAIGPRSALTRWACVRRSVSCGLDVPKLTPWRERTASCFRPLLHIGDDRTPPSLGDAQPPRPCPFACRRARKSPSKMCFFDVLVSTLISSCVPLFKDKGDTCPYHQTGLNKRAKGFE